MISDNKTNPSHYSGWLLKDLVGMVLRSLSALNDKLKQRVLQKLLHNLVECLLVELYSIVIFFLAF